jgi:hypothetical protein
MSFSLPDFCPWPYSAKRRENAIEIDGLQDRQACRIDWLAASRNFKQDFKREKAVRGQLSEADSLEVTRALT